jgi:ankyrin repeat protein
MKTIMTIICFLGLTLTTVAQDKNEQLYEAVTKNDKDKVEKLIDKGADVNYIKHVGPWMKVSVLIIAVNNKNIEIAKLLLENKADVNWKDGFNSSAILYATSSGNIEMVKLLLEYGADINDNDGKGNTVLTAAKESKDKDLISFVEKKLKEKE